MSTNKFLIEINMFDKYEELNKAINRLQQELKNKQERRIYNIYAGVCQKSIITQAKEINKLEQYIEALEYKYEHKLLR